MKIFYLRSYLGIVHQGNGKFVQKLAAKLRFFCCFFVFLGIFNSLFCQKIKLSSQLGAFIIIFRPNKAKGH